MRGFMNRIDRNPFPVIISVAMLLVAACTTLQTQTFAQRYDDAVATLTVVLTTTTGARQNGLITKSDEAHIINYVENSKAVLDEARKVESTDPKTAESKLVLATSVLNDAQKYLAEHKNVRAVEVPK